MSIIFAKKWLENLYVTGKSNELTAEQDKKVVKELDRINHSVETRDLQFPTNGRDVEILTNKEYRKFKIVLNPWKLLLEVKWWNSNEKEVDVCKSDDRGTDEEDTDITR